jgi:phosphonate transport system substrate-binding protein
VLLTLAVWKKLFGLLSVGCLLAAACTSAAPPAPAGPTASAALTPAAGAAPAASAATASAPASGAGATTGATDDSRADWPSQLTLGLFGGDDSEATLQQNQPVTDYISQKVGIPVKMFTGTSYSAVIEAMRAKRVDAMTVGPFSYILAAQEAGAEALAIGVSTQQDPGVFDPTIRPAYFSVISVKKGNGINSWPT